VWPQRHELLASSKFKWSVYLSRSMQHEIEELIEINWKTWMLLILVLSLTLPIKLPSREALVGFCIGGWALLVGEIGVLHIAEAAIDHLNRSGHLQRKSAERHVEIEKARAQGDHEQIPHHLKDGTSLWGLLQVVTSEAAHHHLHRVDQADPKTPLARIRLEELQTGARRTRTA
jgi:hypothetical protein